MPSELPLREVLADRSVRTLFIGQFLISTAVAMQATALGKQAFDISGRELDIGLLGLAEFLPAALLVLVAGQIADRHDRRLVALFGLSGELLCAVALAAYAWTEPTSSVPLFLIALGFGTARAFANPALRSMPPMVAPEHGLHRVIALYSTAWTGAGILGPGATGFLLAVHPGVAYTTAGVLMAIGMTTIARVTFRRRPEPPTDRPSVRHALEGLRFIRNTPIVFAAISLDLFAVLFGGAIALLPVIASERLGVGDIGYGWLRAGASMGAAAMAILLAVRPINRRVGYSLFLAVGLFGICTIVLGLTRAYVIAFAAVVLLSAADMVSVYIRGTLVPLVTPEDKRGRVLAVEAVFIGASNELGAFESGVAAAAFGTPFAVISGGVGTLVVVALWIKKFPSLRRVDTFNDPELLRVPTA